MKIDSSYAILMVLIIGVLVVIYAVAHFAKLRKRHLDREMLESVLLAREKGAESDPEAVEKPRSSLPIAAIVHKPVSLPIPAIKLASPKPHPKALIAWVPPVSEGTPSFNHYITWAGSKIATPVAERSPSEQDYVWN